MKTRLEHDSLGDVEVPEGALFAAQTQRAVENFQISGYRFPREFIATLAMVKGVAAEVNTSLGLLDRERGERIIAAASEVEQGRHDDQFPVDIFQTGSGTSVNMNANEVIATLASRDGFKVHPNDHVNLGQSSNDVIPTTIHIAAASEIEVRLIPALDGLAQSLHDRSVEFADVVKTARTHLMDAVPITMGQEISAWEAQVRMAIERLKQAQAGLFALAIGGTAVGTGLNSAPAFGALVAERIAARTGLPFKVARNRFAAIAAPDAALDVSAQLRGVAVVLSKISNDLRWMNSGPVTGLAEIRLPELQPGSSMMPGKVNPVIPEAVAMSCAHVIGNDAAVAFAVQAGSFQLNTMLPLIAWSLLSSIQILARAAEALDRKAIRGFRVNSERLGELAARNPILATALVPRIGYERSADVAREALASGRAVRDVAGDQTSLGDDELDQLLDPAGMTSP